MVWTLRLATGNKSAPMFTKLTRNLTGKWLENVTRFRDGRGHGVKNPRGAENGVTLKPA